ncbi:MAG TPA: hypothetical protein VLM38_24185 [Blastocatellia bacterium]|nr:hypothetical protein [Blastocatellia bacterium]
MDLRSDDPSEQALALERQVEAQAEAAKRAIGEYKKTILRRAIPAGVQQVERQREVELAVTQYIRLRKRLDELRAQNKTTISDAL